MNDLEIMLLNIQSNVNVSNKKLSEVILYGAGNIGRKLYKNLSDSGIDVKCFFDKNVKAIKGINIPIYHPEISVADFKNTNIILSGLFSLNLCKEIKEYLKELGYKNIFALHEINFSEINCKAFYENLFDGSYKKIDILGKDLGKIKEVYSFLSDDKSKKIYLDYIKAHITMDFTKFDEPYDIKEQYLGGDLEYNIDSSRFIDCGGFDGDTIRNFIDNGKKIEKLVVFEPQNELCNKISQYVDLNKQNIKDAIIFPCGVHSNFAKYKFATSQEAASAAQIKDDGDDIIQCVPLDAVLKGFNATLLKMDIEGAEVAALKGAKQIIIDNRPQLAICVYHSLSDIWEIPLLIESYVENYDFYLRSYNYMGLETVLYALPKEKRLK